MTYNNISAISKETISFFDIQEIEEILKIFDIHNLIPELSNTGDNVFVNSLAMLVSALDWHGNKRHLFEALPYNKGRDIDLLDVVNTMCHLGFNVHETEISLQKIDERLMPCLFIPNKHNAQPIVLLSKEDKKIKGFDSMSRQGLVFEAKNVTGTAFFFEKIDFEKVENDKKTAEAAGVSWFKSLFERFRPVMGEILLASLLINLLALAMPLFSMSIYDKVIASGSISVLWQLVLGVLLTISVEFTLRMIRLKSIVWLGVRLDNIVSNTIFERLMLMKASYTEGASISAQVSRIKAFESVKNFFTGPLFSVVVELPFTLIMILAIWIISGPLAYIPIVAAIIYSIILIYYYSRVKLSMKTASLSSSNRQQFSMETIIKMQSLYPNGLAQRWHAKYKEKLGNSVSDSFKSNMISAIIDILAHTISIIAGVAVISYGVELIWTKSITTGALVATMILIWRILAPLQTLSSVLPRLEQLQTSIDQINKLVNLEVERHPRALTNTIKSLKGNIRITNLGLRYSTDFEPVFIGFDLEVNAGEIIVLTGSNGSGKSSILKLINGLYKSQTGTVRIDGINIKQFEPIELRNYIRYLPQSPNFFEGTIKENLLMTNPLATDQEINDALVKVGIMDDIINMPDGLETVIYSHNPSLPNGFVYALNLARILIKKGNILLLDELPNASLNEQAGKAYRDLIVEAKGSKTVFFISQRNDYIKLADKVVILKQGNKPLVMKKDDFINKYEKN